MKSVIIGIHGLRNKPPKYVLHQWWEKSIRDGFAKQGLPGDGFDFHLAYWAHHIHEKPQNPDLTDAEHPQFLAEPYAAAPASPFRNPKPLRKKFTDDIHKSILSLIAGDQGIMHREQVKNIILNRLFTELDIYYHQQLKDEHGALHPARNLIRNELATLLEQHRGKRICLLAHSMGSIIAYDVMTHTVPDIPVHTFITFGSPLGFPVIRTQFNHELGRGGDDETPLPVPPSLERCWINYADPDDETCLNFNLSKNYTHNTHNVRPNDRMVINYYAHNGRNNPHKSYGYLRTGGMARELYRFLELEDAGLLKRLGWLIRPPVL